MEQTTHIKLKPRAEWTREEAEYVENNIVSEIKHDITDWNKDKLEKYDQKTKLNKYIKDREGKITELEAAAAGDSLYVRELNHVSGKFQYFMVSSNHKNKPKKETWTRASRPKGEKLVN